MPILESEMSYEEMRAVVRDPNKVCGDCGATLNLCWGGAYGYNEHILKCSENIEHNRVARKSKLSVYDVGGTELSPIHKRRVKRMKDELGEEKTKALEKYTASVSLTRPQATEILQTIWEGAPDPEIQRAALLCASYGLNPLMGHVYLMKFSGKSGDKYATVLGIKATRLIASRKGGYSYLDGTPRIMTREEQEKAFGEVDETRIWAVVQLKDESGNETRGYGSWNKMDSPYGQEKGNTKWNMAFIRAERQALDRLRPADMPQGFESIDDAYVIEGEYTISESKAQQTAPEPEPKTEAKKTPPAKAQPPKPANEQAKINEAQAKELQDMAAKAGVSLGHLIRDKGWTNITKLGELSVEQHDDLMETMRKVLEPPPETEQEPLL